MYVGSGWEGEKEAWDHKGMGRMKRGNRKGKGLQGEVPLASPMCNWARQLVPLDFARLFPGRGCQR